MWATALEITIAFALPACVVWVAVRSARRRGTPPPSPGDDTYYLVDFGSHDGSACHHSGADFSGPSGESASGGDGGGDGGGGGSSSD
jgi:uncharacterized membrane protein YgcG